MAALFGVWGSGKSTALAFANDAIKALNEVDKGPNTHTFYFDAWEERYSPSPVLSLLAGLVEEDPTKDWTAGLGDGLKQRVAEFATQRLPRYGSTLLRLFRGFGARELKDDEDALEENRRLLEPAYDAACELADHAHARMQFAERGKLLRELEVLALKERGLAADDKLWVIVDNLDRCPSEQILELLEAFQHASGLQSIRLLFALDPGAAAKAITSRYSSFSTEDALAYLDKMFFPIHFMPQFGSDDLVKVLQHNRGNDILNSVAIRTNSKGLTLRHVAYACQAVFRSNPRRSVHFMHQLANWAGQFATVCGLPFDGDWYCTVMAIALVGAKPEIARLLVSTPDRFHRLIFQGNPKVRSGMPLELDPWHARQDALKVYSESDPIARVLAENPQLFRGLGVFIKEGDSGSKGESRALRMAVLMKQLLDL
ncbi:MAG: hypothetical protein H6839_05640 [Planctomycetes bacterium]|nr:hypothetical protein [Planctomycetota bacterium]